MPNEPLVDEQGEVRELSEADLARARIGAPWTRPTDAAREALRDAIAALERTQGDERAAVAPTLDHLRASLRQLDRVLAET
jgi:hypothetical protein